MIGRAAAVGVLAAVLFCPAAGAQEVLEEMSAGALLAAAGDQLSSENYGASIPYLMTYLERMAPVEDDQVKSMCQQVRLKLGQIMAWLEDPQHAVTYLSAYTQNLPQYQPREAYKLLAVNLYAMEEYEQSVAAAETALSRPMPVELPSKKKKKVDYDTLSETERAGFSARQLRRMEEELNDETGGLSKGLSDDRPDRELDYTPVDLVLLHMTLAEARAKLGLWEESIEPYRYVIDNAQEEDRRGFAVMQLVNAMIALGRFDEAADFILTLVRTEARYDIRVNMAMMTAGASLLDAGEYDSALMLYRMVLPRADLIAYQEVQMNQIRRDSGLPEMTLSIVTNEVGQLDAVYGSKHSDVLGKKADSALPLPPKPLDLIKLEEAVGTLISLPPYENEVLYRTGVIYAQVGRPWEAVTALDLLVQRDQDSEVGMRAFAEALMVLADPLQKYEMVETRGFRFLDRSSEGLGPRMVAHAMTICYQKQERWKAVKELLPVIEEFVESDDGMIRQYECELFYLQAVADMVMLNYAEARDGFEKVLAEYPDSHQQENAVYWHALTQLFLKNHAEALAEFKAYAAAWPEGSWRPSTVFHSGLCLFGLEQLPEAQLRFTRVIETWPEAQVYPDACSLRGDLLAAEGRLDEAQADYEEAIAAAHTVKQATYAVFQMASMFEMEERYDEILSTVNAYLERYAENADVAKAAYWLGKTKLAQGLVDEAVEVYRQAIVDYGGDVLQEGVDQIVAELLLVCRRLSDEERAALRSSLQASLDASEVMALKLRLRVLLADIDGSTDELGRQLTSEVDDLSEVPPPVLALIAEASFRLKDYSRAEEILNLFEFNYEGSDFIKPALKLRAYEHYDAARYAEAEQIADEAQALFGTQVDVVWAQFMKGRVQLQLQAYDAARELFETVLKVSEWRGDPYAEAAFYVGRTEEEAGNLREAFGWYQRVYYLYKGLAGGHWSAESYLAAARCLEKMGLEAERQEVYRAMLYDKYINYLPQAQTARTALGTQAVQVIELQLEQGVSTNITVKLSAEAGQ